MPTESTLPTDVDELHRMIRELRDESAGRRVKLKPYEDAFGSLRDNERQYLLDVVKLIDRDPDKAAVEFRDTAFRMLGSQEKFLEGLDIELPQSEAESDPGEPEVENESQEDDDMAQLTPEQLQEILDERDRKAAEAAAQQQQDAEVEAIFAEIEELGFERGTVGFMSMLSQAQTLAQAGQDPDFSALAPKIRALHDLPDPESEGGDEEEGAPEAGADEDPDPAFPKTADAGGAGGAPTEQKKDWVEQAKEEGRDIGEVARERAEARLAGELVD